MIQWYPGHMTKAKRDMQKKLQVADVVIEILDARAPAATRNPDFDELFGKRPRVVVLNKADLAHPAATLKWVAHLKNSGYFVVPFCAVKSGKHKSLFQAVDEATSKAVEAWAQKGVHKQVRAIVAGIPNVGKSSVINILSGGKRAKVGSTPGVTRGQQWVRISSNLELLDTPGVLWPKFKDEATAYNLAFIGAIRDEVLESLELALKLIDVLKTVSPDALAKRYKIDCAQDDAPTLLRSVAMARGCIQRGSEPDLERAAVIVLNEFRQGKLGCITLELPLEGGPDESKGD